MPGCQAKWDKNSSSVDDSMMRRMARFDRLHAVQSAGGTQHVDVTSIDEEDEGYTQL
jgi:hypothetical protein